ALNRLPWQGQSIVPPLTCVTRHPWCVHTAEKPWTAPLESRVTTSLRAAITTPPPRGSLASEVSNVRGRWVCEPYRTVITSPGLPSAAPLARPTANPATPPTTTVAAPTNSERRDSEVVMACPSCQWHSLP